jgi:hypothetical protein
MLFTPSGQLCLFLNVVQSSLGFFRQLSFVVDILVAF